MHYNKYFSIHFTMFSPWHNMLEKKKLLKSHFDMRWMSFPFLFTLQTYEPYYNLPIIIGKSFGWHVFVWRWKTHCRNDFNTLKQKVCDLKTILNVFCGWKQKTLIQLCGRDVGGVVFQGRWKVHFLIFLFLAWFVALQVIVQWFWWASFSDGAWS